MSALAKQSYLWLWGIPIAWGTSALLLILAEISWLPFLVCFGWLCVAWKCCPSVLRRRAVVSLLALALPVQGFAGITMELRGPAHFHAHGDSVSRQGHAHVERHHHAADEGVVEVADDAHHSAALAAGEDKRTVFGSLDTSTASLFVFSPRSLAGAIPADRTAERAGHIPGRPERPPQVFRDLLK